MSTLKKRLHSVSVRTSQEHAFRSCAPSCEAPVTCCLLDRKGRRAQGHPEEVYGCEFLGNSLGAMHLATCSEDRVYLWDVATGCQLDSAGPPLDIRHEPAGSHGLHDVLLACPVANRCSP